MKTILPSQKKIILAAGIMSGVFLISWLFIYLPARHKIHVFKTEFLNVQNEIKEIDELIPQGASIEEGIKLYEEKNSKLELKFPAREEMALSKLSDEARKANVAIISIKSQSKTQFTDARQQKVELAGKICYQVPVHIEMKTSFINLVNYIKHLDESLPAFMTVEDLKIKKNQSEGSELTVTLAINLYILS